MSHLVLPRSPNLKNALKNARARFTRAPTPHTSSTRGPCLPCDGPLASPKACTPILAVPDSVPRVIIEIDQRRAYLAQWESEFAHRLSAARFVETYCCVLLPLEVGRHFQPAAFASDEVRERAREIVASGNAQLARHPLYKDTGSSQPLDVYFGVRHVRFRAQEERGLELLRGLALDRTAPHFQRITRGALARGYVRQLREVCADLREAPPDSLLGCEELIEEYNERMGRWLPLFPNSTP